MGRLGRWHRNDLCHRCRIKALKHVSSKPAIKGLEGTTSAGSALLGVRGTVENALDMVDVTLVGILAVLELVAEQGRASTAHNAKLLRQIGEITQRP